MGRRLFVALCAVAVLLAAAFALWWAGRRAPIARAAGDFVAAVASGDAERAGELSTGSVAWRAKSAGQPVTAEALDIRIAVPNAGEAWAEARAFVELVLQDGSHDAGWYRLELVNVGGWKVALVSEADPWPAGLWGFAGRRDARAAREVFASYLESLAGNRYQEAAKRLCGPARRAHERGAGVLGKAPLFDQAGNESVVPDWRKGNTMVCRAEYEVDGRRVTVLVRFLKLRDGWHIAGVVQG